MIFLWSEQRTLLWQCHRTNYYLVTKTTMLQNYKSDPLFSVFLKASLIKKLVWIIHITRHEVVKIIIFVLLSMDVSIEMSMSCPNSFAIRTVLLTEKSKLFWEVAWLFLSSQSLKDKWAGKIRVFTNFFHCNMNNPDKLLSQGCL